MHHQSLVIMSNIDFDSLLRCNHEDTIKRIKALCDISISCNNVKVRLVSIMLYKKHPSLCGSNVEYFIDNQHEVMKIIQFLSFTVYFGYALFIL